ncbi:ferric reductase-like transmembrane domain-containing protein [Guyparkeria sp.]|uniref:ferredoxin reductase family protein n=1 Tax=Guyparkeria sp. TaxID=2035736 RepID=UPI003970A654
MNRFIAGIFWILLYLVAVLAPMFIMMIRPTPPGRSFWVEFSIALGFVGLTQMGVQFLLIARYRKVTAPYGIDVILQYHRLIAMMALFLILAHPAILMIHNPALLGLLNPLGGTWASRSGLGAIAALALLVATSVFRQQIKLDYERWRLTHTLLGFAALVLAHAHVSLAGSYLNTVWKQAMWKVFGAAMLSSLVYLRLIRPALQKRERYRVAEVRPERGENYTLVLEPVSHRGLRFAPGQFAWLKLGQTPYTIEEHPFSFSSSSEAAGRLEFGIKVLGDFTRELRHVPAGTDAYLDGPYGAFSLDLAPAAGYVLIAGGIGITPLLSFLKTMADRQDVRPVLLIYGDRSWDGMAYREELDELAGRLNLTIVHVVEKPPQDWRGESGFVTADLLARHLPREKIKREYFVCGPPVMMEAVRAALLERGVPRESIHSERFNLV